MKGTRKQFESIFQKLDKRIDAINSSRREEGLSGVGKSKIKLLGQMSLIANEKISAVLSLAQTADVDALLKMDQIVKKQFEAVLKEHGLLYDEDSYLIWIPKGAKFEDVFNLKNVIVKAIDPESALVSKAVKAPEKNKQIIREAIASGKFPDLLDKIEKNGGDLNFFSED
jgi:hypothetical protein